MNEMKLIFIFTPEVMYQICYIINAEFNLMMMILKHNLFFAGNTGSQSPETERLQQMFQGSA